MYNASLPGENSKMIQLIVMRVETRNTLPKEERSKSAFTDKMYKLK
jgi:hypothetical protein